MFKHFIRSTLFLTLVALFPATATADAKEDILLMGLYRGFDEAAFNFDIKVTAFRNNKATGPAQIAKVYFRSSQATLVDFRGPATVAGRRILTEGKNMWMVLPTSSRTIRVSPDDRLLGQASNGDILNIPVEKYSYAYKGTEKVNGKTYKRIVATLRGGGATYARVDFLLEQNTNKPFRSYHFSRSGKLVKVAEYVAFSRSSGRERVSKIALIDPIVKSNVTIMQFNNYRQQNLPASMFKKSSLRQILN